MPPSGIARKVVGEWYFPLAVEELTAPSVDDDPSGRRGRSRRSLRPSLLLTVAFALAATLFWWWPGLTGRGEDFESSPAVLVVGGGQLERSEEKVLRRLREEGYSAAWSSVPTSWCVMSELLRSSDIRPTRAVVLHVPPTSDSCGEPVAVATGILDAVEELDVRPVIVVGLAEGDRDDPVTRSLVDSGVTVVDPVTLIGEPDEVGRRVDCSWWDDCIFEGMGPGYVVVRDEDGLTAAGQQRVARMIVAAVQ